MRSCLSFRVALDGLSLLPTIAPARHDHDRLPELTVVVAAADCAGSIEACLSSLKMSCAGLDHELRVVVPSGDGTAGQISSVAPGARVILAPVGSLVPVLWAIGISESRGRIIALTIGQCEVESGWARAMIAGIHGGAAGVGGSLRLADAAGRVDAAVFFLRYSAFLGRGRQDSSDVTQIAGDNAAYSHAALQLGGWNRSRGFWETEFHALVLAAGGALRFVPHAEATFLGGARLSAFGGQRFTHGRIFSEWRVAVNDESRWRILLASPVVPAVLIARIVRRVWPHVGYRRRFLSCLPAIGWFALCWAVGEAAGAFRAGWFPEAVSDRPSAPRE